MCWYGGFREYVPVARRQANARREMDRLRKQGHAIQPVEIQGRTIARSYWGKGWCQHLESFSDFSNRLPRGRTYVRNGSVCHLAVTPGCIEAHVAGSKLYQVRIRIAKLDTAAWEQIKGRCAGQIGSMLELLKGKLSEQVMGIVSDRDTGLFPRLGEITLDCSCPDWATMCKHVAAVLYGVGNRLDARPELLFTLRGVDPEELIAAELGLPADADDGTQTLGDDQLADVFGIDFEDGRSPAPPASGDDEIAPRPRTAPPAKRRGNAGTNRKSKGKSRARTAAARAEDQGSRRDARPAVRPTAKSVARLRRQAGMSQAKFAEALGVSPASVARWETSAGRLNLQRRCLDALADLKQTLGGRQG